jgi:hypothetical protein
LSTEVPTTTTTTTATTEEQQQSEQQQEDDGSNIQIKQLLVGISHQSSPLWRLQGQVSPLHTTSNFYAFEQTPPYRVLARSGLCLGFPVRTENEQNYYSQLVRAGPLIMKEAQIARRLPLFPVC